MGVSNPLAGCCGGSIVRTAVLLCAATFLAGCAGAAKLAQSSQAEAVSERSSADSAGRRTVGNGATGEDIDRLERLNRAVYRFNRGFDRRVLRPVARGYDRVVPPKVEKRFRNFFVNLRAPIDIVNNFLQAKFAPGFADFGRFLFNSTIGLGGFFDPATKVGLERHEEDFGQTLAVWGVPSGGYLMLPFLGAGTVRDWGIWPFERRFDLVQQVEDRGTHNELLLWRYVSDRAALLPAERTLDQSFDEYIFVREAYLQHRRYEITDGEATDDYLYLDSDE